MQLTKIYFLVGGFWFSYFPADPGGMIQFDDRIFSMGWFNHQLGLVVVFVLGMMTSLEA